MPPQTRAAKRARIINLREQALGIVLSSGCLAWYEAVKLGETCKDLYYEWQEKKDHICEPVLASFKRLRITTNVCQRCGKASFPAAERQCLCTIAGPEAQSIPMAHLDPRFNEEIYSQLSTWGKCQAMTVFTATLLSNFRTNFSMENPTQSGRMPCRLLGRSFHGLQFLEQEKPRRVRFMMNLFLAIMFQHVLYEESRGFAMAYQAFGMYTTPGSAPAVSFGGDGTSPLNRFLPGTNNILESIIQISHNSGVTRNGYMKVWETLGPVLTRKLDFFATFVNENGTPLLPGDMEPISSEEEERIRGMMCRVTRT